MASTYSTNLRVELMADGENSTTWGSKTNVNLNLLEQAISGVASVAMTDADYTLTTSNALADEARNAVVTMTGTLTQARNVIVPSVDKQYVFKNSTTGGFSIVVKTSGGTGVTIPNGETVQVYCDATNVEVAATAVGKIRFTQPANGATFTLLDGKTLTVNNTLTLAGTDGTVMTFPATNATLARTDAANTFTGIQDFDGRIDANAGLAVTGANFTSRGITDSATALALTLSGSGANSVTITNSATNPTIGTSAGNLALGSAGNTAALQVLSAASGATYILASNSATGGLAYLSAAGDTNTALGLSSGGTDPIILMTNDRALTQVQITHTASAATYLTLTGAVASGFPTIGVGGTTPAGLVISANIIALYGQGVEQVRITGTPAADRFITMSGSNGGNPTIGTNAGGLGISADVVADGFLQLKAGTATPAGGIPALYMGTSAHSIGFGSGTPTYSALKGSWYLRSDGSTTNNRAYINTDGGTTWTAVITAA